MFLLVRTLNQVLQYLFVTTFLSLYHRLDQVLYTFNSFYDRESLSSGPDASFVISPQYFHEPPKILDQLNLANRFILLSTKLLSVLSRNLHKSHLMNTFLSLCLSFFDLFKHISVLEYSGVVFLES